MANLTTNEADFVQGVSSQTGIDPRVLIAWIQGEGAPGNSFNNYLNIASSTAQSLGVPTVGTAAAGTAEFGNVQTGITATVNEIRNLGLNNLAGKTPAQAISEIAASPWASSHYGGAGGPNLQSDFASIFGGSSALGSAYEGPGLAKAITGDINIGGSAAIGGVFGSGDLGTVGSKVSGAASGVAGALNSPFAGLESAYNFLTSYRFAEIIGGVLLLIVGLYIVAKNFGLKVPGGAVVSRLPGV